MLIDWTAEFDRWLDRLSDRAEEGAEQAIAQLARINAAFEVLENLTAEPEQDADVEAGPAVGPQHGVADRTPVHPRRRDPADRLVPPQRPGAVVVVLFGADKAAMGDVFYDSVGSRANAAISTYQLTTEAETELEGGGP